MSQTEKSLEERIAEELAAADAREEEETGNQQVVLSGPPVRHIHDFYQFKFGFERLPVEVTLADGEKGTILYETLIILNVMDGSETRLYFTEADREELERKVALVKDEIAEERKSAAEEEVAAEDQEAVAAV